MTDCMRRAGVVLALAAVAASWQVSAGEQLDEEAVAAVWKSREVDFYYRSSIAIFSCGALKDRVSAILRGIGARDDVQVRLDNCSDTLIPSGMPATNTWNTTTNPANPNTWQGQVNRFPTQPNTPQQVTHVRVRLMFPTEITPEILAEIDRDKSRRELISRVTGNPAANLNDPVVFAAKRQRVTLSRETIGLDPVECELLDQMSTSVFRKLDVHVVQRSSVCDRNSISRISPRLTAEALIGIPLPAGEMVLKFESEEDAKQDVSDAQGESDVEAGSAATSPDPAPEPAPDPDPQ